MQCQVCLVAVKFGNKKVRKVASYARETNKFVVSNISRNNEIVILCFRVEAECKISQVTSHDCMIHATDRLSQQTKKKVLKESANCE